MEGKSVEEYLAVLYPENEKSDKISDFIKEYNKNFLEQHIEEINKYYIRFGKDIEFYGEKWKNLTDIELMEKSIKEAKIRYYYKKLNPEDELDTANSSNSKFTQDIDFIFRHLYEFEDSYLGFLKIKETKFRNLNESDLLQMSYREAKEDAYLKAAHLDDKQSEQYSKEESEFIIKNLEEIDKEYRRMLFERADRRKLIDKTIEERTVKKAIEVVKERQLNASKETNEEKKDKSEEEEEIVQKNKPEEDIEELLKNINMDGSKKETEPKQEEIQQEDEKNASGANSYDIEIPTKQTIDTRDLANADMNAELTSSDITKKKNFIRGILDKIKSSDGR